MTYTKLKTTSVRVCPHCKSENVISHSAKKNNGSKRYRCKDCNKTSTFKNGKYYRHYQQCPFCKKYNTVKRNGKLGEKQRYYCTLCEKSFLYGFEEINKIVSYWLDSKFPDIKVVNDLKIPQRTLGEMIKFMYPEEFNKSFWSNKSSNPALKLTIQNLNKQAAMEEDEVQKEDPWFGKIDKHPI